MSLQELGASDVVVATGKGRINCDPFRITIDFQLQTSYSIVPTHGIDLRPGTQMDNTLQSSNLIQTL